MYTRITGGGIGLKVKDIPSSLLKSRVYFSIRIGVNKCEIVSFNRIWLKLIILIYTGVYTRMIDRGKFEEGTRERISSDSL